MVESRLEIALFGPVECRVDGRTVTVPSAKQRAILAVLALEAPRVVSTDRLIDALWGDDPPPAARNSLEAHISRLRKLLSEAGADGVLRTQPPGYALDAETDLRRFERLLAIDAAAALELWRGPALDDVADEPFARVESPRLEELHLSARESLVAERLDRGEHRAALPELERLVAEHPLRERFRELLMRALYAADRQADALEVYRETVRMLRDELGLQPGPALRALEQSILRHDPALRGAVDRTAEQAPPARKQRRLALAAVAAALVAAGGTAAGVLLTGGPSRAVPSHPIQLGRHLLASIPSPLPSCCGFGFGRVWIVGHHDETLKEIDPATNRIVGSYRVAGFQALEPLVAAGSIWIPAAGGYFTRFDPTTHRVVHRWPENVAQVAWGYDSIWATTRDHQLLRINLRTNRIVARLRLLPGANDFDDDVQVGFGSVWVTATDDNTLLRIDPVTNAVVGRISGFGDTSSWMPLTVGDSSVWVYRISGEQGVLYRIDPYTNQIVKRIPVGKKGVAWPNGYIVDAGGYVWTGDAGSTLTAVDPKTNRVAGWFRLPESSQEIAFGDGSIWLALYDHSVVYRINPAL